MRRLLIVATLGGVAALAACSSGGDGSGSGTLDLTGTWTLQSGSTSAGEIAVTPDAPVTMDVADDGTVSGTSACNQYTTAVEVDGTDVSFGPAGVTMMACPDAVMAVETAYLGALADVSSGERDGDSLVLTGGGAELVFAPTS
ncbi:META domain-containing protein [Actinotalea sp. M2MS4P-6]|uniref:META domain-containing protein n=1 Tax=Actinotalea sp. M2MS4P-6 TaxID=2983762 RepID=UPI0021E46FF9|nr:META domain-containing protein [Actinotalea sp. M2MS4P-6]MCV2395231.1 META domain-containing protein [Actinotalea sp. M2MS4P-6]